MECTKCNVAMLEGMLSQNGMIWSPRSLNKLGHNLWGLQKVIVGTRFYIIAFRCPQCNKIELVTAEIK